MEVREKYSPENYEALEIGAYRTRFPGHTEGMSDEKLFDIVMGTDDDMSDTEWATLFANSR